MDQAHCLRTEAHRLLYEEGLFPLVSTAGPAVVVGSYAFDLMTWPDLDIDVHLPHEKDIAAFFDLGGRIATGFQVMKLTFSNQFIRPDVPFDHGLYAGIRLLLGDREWKIDLWGYGEVAFRSHMKAFEELQSRLEAADRLTILRIKDDVCRRPGYRFEVSSVDVYEAVANNHVRTVAEFDEWLCARVVAVK